MIKSAAEILEKNTGHAYALMFNMCYESMIEYAQQFIDEAASLVNNWENSGTFREGLLEELNPQNK